MVPFIPFPYYPPPSKKKTHSDLLQVHCLIIHQLLLLPTKSWENTEQRHSSSLAFTVRNMSYFPFSWSHLSVMAKTFTLACKLDTTIYSARYFSAPANKAKCHSRKGNFPKHRWFHNAVCYIIATESKRLYLKISYIVWNFKGFKCYWSKWLIGQM